MCAAGEVKRAMCADDSCHRDIFDEDNYEQLGPQVLVFPALNFHGCAANSSCAPLKPIEQQHSFMNDLQALAKHSNYGGHELCMAVL